MTGRTPHAAARRVRRQPDRDRVFVERERHAQRAPGRPDVSRHGRCGPSGFSTSGTSGPTAGRPATRRSTSPSAPSATSTADPRKTSCWPAAPIRRLPPLLRTGDREAPGRGALRPPGGSGSTDQRGSGATTSRRPSPLKAMLEKWMRETRDRGSRRTTCRWDTYPYHGIRHRRSPGSSGVQIICSSPPAAASTWPEFREGRRLRAIRIA